jgi:hypothetical protein
MDSSRDTVPAFLTAVDSDAAVVACTVTSKDAQIRQRQWIKKLEAVQQSLIL